MDQVKQYRPIIERILGDHLEFLGDDTQVEAVRIVDKNGENYLLIEIGWEPPRRVYNVILHVRLKDDKIWIEQDWTREGVGSQLVDAGVPATLVELGYQPPEMRPYVAFKMASS
jgi:hypothetical protein